jgi:hypothetical protein
METLLMKKYLFIFASLFAASANATLLFSNVSYTADSVTFTVDGNMQGYAEPTGTSYYSSEFSIIYGGDIWNSPDNTFLPNSWSRSIFDNKYLSGTGYTGTSLTNYASYSWSMYDSSLTDAFVNSAAVTLTMSSPRLDINALNPIISFAWGNGQNGPGYHTLLQTVNLKSSAVPEPASIALLGLGIAGLGFVRRRKAA